MFLQPKTYAFFSRHLISSYMKILFLLQLLVNQKLANNASKRVNFAPNRPSVVSIARMRAQNQDFP